MRHMEICRKNIILEDDQEETLVYFVTIDDITDTAAGIVLESYGVGVTISESDESSVIANVTFSRKDILNLINLLADHLVTPVTVCDVVDDWLCAV